MEAGPYDPANMSPAVLAGHMTVLPQWRRGLTTPQTRPPDTPSRPIPVAAMEAGPYDPANRSLSLPPLTRAVAADGERWAATVEMMHPRTGFVRLSRCIVAGTELASGPRGKSRHLSAR